MAWKPKTIAGKIIKGAVIGGGSLLGLAAGTRVIGAASGIIKGTGALAGINNSVISLHNTKDKVKESALRLITGSTKEERALIQAQKEKTREAQNKLELVEKLVNAGATPEEARAQAGITSTELTEVDGKPIRSGFMGGLFANPFVKWGAIAVGIYFLLKALKIIK